MSVGFRAFAPGHPLVDDRYRLKSSSWPLPVPSSRERSAKPAGGVGRVVGPHVAATFWNACPADGTGNPPAVILISPRRGATGSNAMPAIEESRRSVQNFRRPDATRV